MCGVAGIVALDGSAPAPDVVRRMVGRLAHRGPDDEGLFSDEHVALGHRRLSILDPTPAGAQPMRRGDTWLVHNGEIYNYLELASELRDAGCVLVTETDTEVILAAYQAWGMDAIRRFNGMWAFALWDAPRQRLVLSRDRIGVKPLYIRRTSRSLVFASEVSALAETWPVDLADGWRPSPDLAVVRDFLVSGAVDHSEHTFLEGVTSLPPANNLIVERGQITFQRYWPAPPLADDDRPFVRGRDAVRDAELVEEFGEAFDRSVQLRLRSDVPIGTCLSGGLDSSSIVMTASHVLAGTNGNGSDRSRHEQQPRFAFHARYPGEGIDESRYAEMVAAAAGISLVYQAPRAGRLVDALLPVLRSQGEPFGGASILAQYSVMEAAHASRLKVLLDGQGADELLGGYDFYIGVRAAGLLRAGMPRAAAHELRAAVGSRTLPAGLAVRGLVRALAHGRPNEWARSVSAGRYGMSVGPILRREATLRRARNEQGTFLARRLWQDLMGMSALLRYEDRNSMAFGIESRVPFLDVNLVELAVRLPDRLRVGDGTTKVVLRRSMTNRLPAPVRDRRDKLGFAAPEAVWLANDLPSVQALVSDGQAVARGWVSRGEARRLIENHQAVHAQLWKLLVTECWLRLTFPGHVAAKGTDVWNSALDAERDRLPTS
jgi:asparagine synthase (glutamine-hydrolysing)